MKKIVMLISNLLFAVALLMPFSKAFADTDGFYDLFETTYTWDGTDADRTKATSADYDYSYGDEEILTYHLPWGFNYYGQSYSSINIDTNGNIWFTNSSPASSFNLQNTSKGPVIAAWNSDLSSQYYGGAFVQHKTNPERVVIEWQAETYAEEGSYLTNNFEVVLSQTGAIQFNYKSFSPDQTDDSGSGISEGNNSNYSAIVTAYTMTNRSFITSAIPHISVVPSSDSFSSTVIGTTSASRTFTVTNSGKGLLSTSSASINGMDSSMFSITSNACTGQNLFPSHSCNIQVAFAPTSQGAKAAELWIMSNDPDTPTKAVTLNGTGINPTLTITGLDGSSGTVTISLNGISCTTNCSYEFEPGSAVTLTATPATCQAFMGWSQGACYSSWTGACNLTISADTNVATSFSAPHSQISRTGTVYSTLQDAYNEALDGDVIKVKATSYTEGFTANRSISVTVDGGYDCNFSSKTGTTTLQGNQVNINDGTVTMMDVIINQ